LEKRPRLRYNGNSGEVVGRKQTHKGKDGMLGVLFRRESASQAQAQQAFEAHMRASYRQAYGFALRLTQNPVEAEDLTQETYVRAFRFFHRYDEALPFLNWLYRIMSNAHIDQLRRKSRLKLTSLDQPALNASSPLDLPDQSPNADQRLQHNAMGPEVERALATMTPEFRTAVLLADVEGLAYEEIAEIMETSVGTVRSRIHRGRKQLRHVLNTNHPELFQLEGDDDEL
jgi:RNA polymerase sigma-70 factor, ECF subfamily